MVKQRTEVQFKEHFLKQLHHINNWWIKFQVFPGACTPMPADYVLLTEDKNYLFECKEVDISKNPKNRWAWERYTQDKSIMNFIKSLDGNNQGYVFVCWWRGRFAKSDCYLIQAGSFSYAKQECRLKTLSFEQFDKIFNEYKITKEDDLIEFVSGNSKNIHLEEFRMDR